MARLRDKCGATKMARRPSIPRARVQVLFLWDLRKQAIGEAISSFYDTLGSEEENPEPTDPDEFMETLVRGAVDNVASIDKVISDKSANWRRLNGCLRWTAISCVWRFMK